MKFKLRKGVGTHAEGDRIYKSGEVLESDHDLVKMFPNKFIVVKPNAKLAPGVLISEAVQPKLHGDPPEPPEDEVEVEVEGEEEEVPAAGNEDEDGDENEQDDAVDLATLSKIKSKLGRNVTANFRDAARVGVLIAKRGGKFYAVVPEMPDRSVPNAKGLTKEEMEIYLAGAAAE